MQPSTAIGNEYRLDMFITDLSKPFDPEWRVKIDGEPPDPMSSYSAECCVQDLSSGKYRIFFLSATCTPRQTFDRAMFGEVVYRLKDSKRFIDAFCAQLWVKLQDKRDFPIPRFGQHDFDFSKLEEGIVHPQAA